MISHQPSYKNNYTHRKITFTLFKTSSGNEGEIAPSQGHGGIGRRSIADALGDDEFDVMISQEGNYQK